MAEVSQNTKYVKLDDGVSFLLVRTNPKLTTNTKLMYNGKKMYMESYAYSPLMNTTKYKNVPVKQNSTYNRDIASFLTGSGSQAYNVYQNFSNITISDSYDNQFETLYWCGAEYIDSSFYTEKIGFVAPLYLREKLPNYFLIFRLDTPSNYNLNVDDMGNILDSTFDFKTDILDKAVLIKTFDLREGSVLGNYIHRYVEQDLFEFDKSMYINFSNAEVTYYGINKFNGVLEKKVENFENELLKNDNPILKDDKWFTEGFERNNLIFPYIMNIEYLFDDDNFKNGNIESYDFARYIGVYCNNIEFGEFSDFRELNITEDNVIYYFEDNNKNLHRYVKINKDVDSSDIDILDIDSSDSDGSDIDDNYEILIDGKDIELFDKSLISGFEKERITGYAEPLDIYEGFINRAQYGFEIQKPFEPGDWVGIEYDNNVECYFADNKTINAAGDIQDMLIGEYEDFRFSVNEKSSLNDIAEALVKAVNHNKESKFEARCVDNFVVFFAKREGEEYNKAKMLIESSLLYNKKISLPSLNYIKHVNENDRPIEHISVSDSVLSVSDSDGTNVGESVFGNYYVDHFYGACDVDIDIDPKTDTYKNVFKIYAEEYAIFDINRYLKTKNGNGRKISTNMIYINLEGKIYPEYRLIIVDADDVPEGGGIGYDVSVSSTYQVEIMDVFKPNHGVLSWFPVKDFDFDINFSSYGQYSAFVDECNKLSKKITYIQLHNIFDTYADSDSKSTLEDTIDKIKELAKSPFFDDYGNYFATEYDYYFEQIHPDMCLLSKSVPYISKWGYYDEQKDSCENPYRLNVSKVFGVSNLSANVYLNGCDENEYTHSMPYYMIFDTPDYSKEYQYIESNEEYKNKSTNNNGQYVMSVDDDVYTYDDCISYWINIFKNTDVDMFSYFLSSKKYGKRFYRKYSRILSGDKFHNPSTLFRGVKFEVVRQYNGIEKKSSEYNGYKFSFIYIPVMVNSLIFNSTVYFVKNDTFKFIVGIIFVNTMLGIYNHNIFKGGIDYFNKGFLYAACKDIIRPESRENIYKLTLTDLKTDTTDTNITIPDVKNNFWKDKCDMSKKINEFYMWNDGNNIVITKENKSTNFKGQVNVIGEFKYDKGSGDIGISEITKPKPNYNLLEPPTNKDEFDILFKQYYDEYDVTIHGFNKFKYFGKVSCEPVIGDIEFNNLTFIDVCNVKMEYDSEYTYIDISNISFKAKSLQNILINMGTENSVKSIKIYDDNNVYINIEHGINVDFNGSITITNNDNNDNEPVIIIDTTKGSVENLKMDIIIKDSFTHNMDSLGFKDYFSIFNQLSVYNICENINNDYNVKYYSTVEDNKYKIRIIKPDSIEILDKYEAIPVNIMQNNKSVVGSVEIKEKTNIDRIGKKVINRYSGYYNPIFNDILYYGDFTYIKYINEEKFEFELSYSNTNIDFNYSDVYGDFGIIKNMYYHKTNINRSDKILTSDKPIYPVINEYALDYRDYNIFSSSWDDGYFISQEDLDTSSYCFGIGSMKEGLCMFGSKYLNLPDDIFIDTFINGKIWNDTMVTDIRDNTSTEIMYKEINNSTVRYYLFIEKRLKRYLTDSLIDIFEKYINKEYSLGNKKSIYDDVEKYVEKNILKLYKVDKVYLYIKSERMRINNMMIENEYLEYMDKNNKDKIKYGFPVVDGKLVDSKFIMGKVNEFDRIITYNLNRGFKESFGIGVSIKRK